MGPFAGYAPPGVYTKTLLDPSVTEVLGTLRIPAIIGVGEETKRAVDYDLIRGSASFRDNKRVGEDVSSQLSGGTDKTFNTLYFPIVSGSGSGAVTNNPNHVEAFVNGSKVIVSQVDGATGTVILQVTPDASDTVTINYYFKLTDTRIIDEDASAQADGTNLDFYTAYAPIVDGTNGGRTTTSTNDVIVKVNGLAVALTAVDGISGYVTLVSAPLITDTVTITYYYNSYANTADYLPYVNPVTVERVGDTPGSSDYTEGSDFVIKNDQIYWGTTYILEADVSIGTEYFDDSQISVSLIDERIYLEDVSSQFATAAPANPINYFTVAYTPIVDGTGRDIVTEDPSKILVYVNSALVSTTRIDGLLGKVYFTPAVTNSGDTVEVTYWHSNMSDETYTLECTTSGGIGVGQYSITDADSNTVYLSFDNGTGTAITPVYFNGPRTDQANAVIETVTLTFTSATAFTVTSTNGSGTASGATTSGQLDKTFIDDVTGLTFTLNSTGTYGVGKTVVIDVVDSVATPVTTATTTFEDIAGVSFSVNNTTNVAVSDTAVLTTYDKSGNEPAIGNLYYITYSYEKIDADYEPKVFTKFKDVTNEYGELSVNNPLSLAAYLLFINGAVAIITKQIRKVIGGTDASEVDYISALVDLEKPVEGLPVAVVLPLTSSTVVQNAVKSHVNRMSSERYRAERVHIFGTAVGTEPQDAVSIAQGFSNERSWMVYPDGAVIAFVDAYGTETEYILDGTYLAVCMTGVNVSPAFDVATPMTRKTISGLRRLVREMDEVTKDTVAAGGITVIELVGASLRIRHSLTTDLGSPYTKKPEVVTIKDEAQQAMRQALDKYIGRKVLSTTARDISLTTAGVMRGLVNREIIVEYANISVEQNAFDPSFFEVTVFYIPVVGLDYIEVTFNIRSSL